MQTRKAGEIRYESFQDYIMSVNACAFVSFVHIKVDGVWIVWCGRSQPGASKRVLEHAIHKL